MKANLSRIIMLAHEHGGTYNGQGTGRWPWPYPLNVRRDDSVNCSTLSLSVLMQAFTGLVPPPVTYAAHRLWMCASDPTDPFRDMPRAMGPVFSANLLDMDTHGDTGVTLHQAWKGTPLKSKGHTWIQVAHKDGPRVIDATPDKPWCGVRILAPRPAWKWKHEFSVNLNVDATK